MARKTGDSFQGQRLVRNVLWNFGGQGWSLVLVFFTTPYIIHKLGMDAYGLLMTVGIVTNYFWFMDLGLGQAIVKYIAEHAARDEWDEINRIFWTSIGAYLVLGAIAALALIAIAPPCVYRWFRIPAELQTTALSVFYLSAFGFIIGMLNSTPASIPRGLQRFDIVNKIGAGVGTTQTLLTVVLLALDFSVREVVLGSLVVAGLSLALNAIIAWRLLPQLSLPIWHFPTFRKLLRFGGFVTVSGVVGPILVNLEKVILANQISMSAVTHYTVPYNLTTKLSTVPGAFSTALFPAFSNSQGMGRKDVSVDLSLSASRYIMLLLMPLVVLLVVFGEDFLNVWIGAEFAHQSSVVLQILAAAMLVNAAALSPFALIQAFGRPDLTAKFHLVELVLHLPLTLVCVQLWGVVGAALAWLIRVALDTTLLWGATIVLTGSNWRRPARALFNQGVWAMIASGAVLWVSKAILKEHLSSLEFLIAFGSVFLVVAGFSGWRWGTGVEERQLIWHSLRTKGTKPQHD